MANIAVLGTGYVGSVSGACLADFGNQVICADTNEEKIASLKKGIIPIFEPGLDIIVDRNIKAGRLSFTTDIASAVKLNEVVFIAVGTPPQEDGSADLHHVEAAARSIGKVINRYTVVVDKSTVPIGTGHSVKTWIADELKKRGADIPFDVVSNPEFLREGSAVQDFTHPDRVVIGCENEKARNIMKDVYRALYINETPYIETNLESAEMIKYASNAFLAVKITFINEIANLCEKVGADVQSVAKAMGRDGRIGGKFLHPGPGYGGSCFPKDTRALARIGRDNDEVLEVIETAIRVNENQKRRMVDKVENVFGGSGFLQGKTIAVLGLAFKPNTDDMRESPAITICEGLVSRGAKIRAYDPAAEKEAAWRFASIKDSFFLTQNEYEAISGADALILLTEWNQFRNMDLKRIKDQLTLPYFFDLRNVYKREDAESVGLHYFGTGR
jgi:UDPglucose 6-dehydrogenase